MEESIKNRVERLAREVFTGRGYIPAKVAASQIPDTLNSWFIQNVARQHVIRLSIDIPNTHPTDEELKLYIKEALARALRAA